jgi:hypothetical protein
MHQRQYEPKRNQHHAPTIQHVPYHYQSPTCIGITKRLLHTDIGIIKEQITSGGMVSKDFSPGMFGMIISSWSIISSNTAILLQTSVRIYIREASKGSIETRQVEPDLRNDYR